MIDIYGDFAYTLDEILSGAMMSGTPVIIVEGEDDIEFYGNIAKQKNFNVYIRPVETIIDYNSGCDNVIKAIQDSINLIQKDNRLKKYIMGIIDKDVRDYLNEIPEIENLLILKFYNHETHLITDKSINLLIKALTKAPKEIITQDVINYLKNEFKTSYEDYLYYFSLEALKRRFDPTYDTVVNYSDSGTSLFNAINQPKGMLLNEKIPSLDNFALEKGIQKEHLKKIANGKWIVSFWSHYLEKKVKTLHILCGQILPKCLYCISGKKEQCLWKRSVAYQHTHIENMLKSESYIDLTEIQYVSDFIETTLFS